LLERAIGVTLREMKRNRLWLQVATALLVALTLIGASRAQEGRYFPSREKWEQREPADVGMEAALLAEAVEWARKQETDWPRDFSTQAAIFGRPLGPVPKTRAGTNGIILRRGYIVAEWGNTSAVDPTYSAAKSYLSTLLGIAIDRGLIKNVTDRVGEYVRRAGDDGYDSERNAKVTWQHHATQTSEWEGTMFGKAHTFLGKEEFGRGEMKPRELREPGTHYEYNDVRVNRFSLSLLRVWKRPLPEVLKTEVMDKIGASSTWAWHPYDNAIVQVDGKPMPSVSGGTRWGGGLWISTRDQARFGLLMLRKGEWKGERIVSEDWVREATRQQGKQPAYGYLWWLNCGEKPAWPDMPRESFAAQGAGSNTVWVDPEHELVVVWRWHKGGGAQGEFYRRVVRAVKKE
jgi:CubicO group peptidase (beta-lactamase class C family)